MFFLLLEGSRSYRLANLIVEGLLATFFFPLLALYSIQDLSFPAEPALEVPWHEVWPFSGPEQYVQVLSSARGRDATID